MVIRESRIHGRGAFAAEDIRRDELIAARGGSVVSYEDALLRDSTIGGFSMQIEEGLFLCPDEATDLDDLGVFINHSCDPNVGIRGQLSFVALRDIAAGEELTFDYAMNVSSPYVLRCRCGIPSCRRVVSGDDWRDSALQRKYQGYFDAVITRRIERPSGGACDDGPVPLDGPVHDRIIRVLQGFDHFHAFQNGRISAREYEKWLDTLLRLPGTLPLNENERALSSRLCWRTGTFLEDSLVDIHAAGGVSRTVYDWPAFAKFADLVRRSWCHDGYSTYIFPEEAQLLYALVEIRAPSRVVALGSFYGYWTAFAIAARRNGCHVTLVDLDPAAAALASRNLANLGMDSDVEVIVGDAVAFLAGHRGDGFDLAILDAEGTSTDPDPRMRGKAVYGPILEALGPTLDPSGACLVAHNILLDNRVEHPYFERLVRRNRNELGEFLTRVAEIFPHSKHLASTEGVGVFWS